MLKIHSLLWSVFGPYLISFWSFFSNYFNLMHRQKTLQSCSSYSNSAVLIILHINNYVNRFGCIKDVFICKIVLFFRNNKKKSKKIIYLPGLFPFLSLLLLPGPWLSVLGSWFGSLAACTGLTSSFVELCPLACLSDLSVSFLWL